MNAAQQRQLTPWLAALALLLGAGLLILLLGVGRGSRWDPPRQIAPLPPPTNPNDLPKPQPLTQFALVWNKPLFNPARKPVSHASDGGSSLGDLELSGIILTPGLKMALLHEKNGDKQVRLREGASLPDGSVTLVEVKPRSAVFDAASGRTELKLPAGAPINARRAPRQDEDAAAMAPEQSGGTGMVRVDAPTPNDGPRSAAAPPAKKAAARSATTGGGLKRLPTSKRLPPSGQSATSAVERLRKNIQQRRAARAAAAHEGER